ncbi:MAG: NADH-quinone oxidoreductase subunit H [Planctomycetota bacterium]|nr:MAG: NADH-quinone oxidoreductase subunit H [Planctomycetota bacterium]
MNYEFLIEFAKIGLVFIPLTLIPVMIFLERKGAAIIQDRVGPNRAGIKVFGVEIRGFGMVHNFSDVVKLITKEDFVPARAHKAFYIFAPMIPVATAVITPALIPWFGPMTHITGHGINGAVLDFNIGLLFLFAISAISVYGVVLGSWASNSKYSLLGGMRSSAMMISYEVSMGLSILGLIVIIGSFNMTEIVEWQARNTWGIVVQPLAFFLFLTAMFAETGRTPFDVAEGESEIVGGFHTEYSSIKFALFFMGEYAHVVIASALMATLFLGGYDLLPVPGFDGRFIADNLGFVLAAVLLAKLAIFWGIARLIARQRARYMGLKASDAVGKTREYRLMGGIFTFLGLACLLAAILAVVLIGRPERMGFELNHAPWVGVLTAFVQIGIVLAKTLFFCWLFVWVRWTLPRLRYDQIMGLGWKVLLNVALINLLITAVVVKIINEGF